MPLTAAWAVTEAGAHPLRHELRRFDSHLWAGRSVNAAPLYKFAVNAGHTHVDADSSTCNVKDNACTSVSQLDLCMRLWYNKLSFESQKRLSRQLQFDQNKT